MMILAFLVVVVLICFGLAGYGFGRLGQAGVHRTGRRTRLRCAAALAGAGAAAVYAWGLLLLGLAVLYTDDSGSDAFPPRPCRIAGVPEAAADVVGYRAEYLPPRYVCLRQGGGSYRTDDVPGFVGPGTVGLTATAAVCVLLAGTTAPTSPRKASRT
ncbi:hypothetical protein [Streptomyces sp. NPDC088757]|uniref:hypothetical protein n=1 Tax=Streptomyces sp. NPDC088757 TaxID=3365889 RepID=UPI0037F6AFBE